MTFKARGLYASSSKEPGRFRRGPWLLLGAVLVVIVVVFTALSVLGNVAVHQTDRTDSFSGITALELENSTGGDVLVKGGEGDEVVVERKLSGSPLSEPDEDIDAEGGTLEIDTDCSGFLFFSSCSVHYEITVPAGTRVALETISGKVSVDNLEGDLSVESISGQVGVTSPVGEVDIETISGTIMISDAEGAVTAHSTSGRIQASGEGSLLDVGSTSGEILVADFSADEVRAESVSGSLELGGGFTTLEASSVSGSVNVMTDEPFELLSVETVSGRVGATVPDGVYDITGESVSGNRDFNVEASSGADSRIDVSTTSGGVLVTGN
ncbi:DUF4097 family beta strand repeat-containing protein [Nocardiopsis valliformis]|uniref:DUF4097 family beta strand repeat-containing protein n=1 Tax=Nocardiopsis valliformis TaxID=239974 RepID=UPI00034D0C4F|nr:DUF4097 family beta strand repeat-containing protein [Nocardiopsis valliformis]